MRWKGCTQNEYVQAEWVTESVNARQKIQNQTKLAWVWVSYGISHTQTSSRTNKHTCGNRDDKVGNAVLFVIRFSARSLSIAIFFVSFFCCCFASSSSLVENSNGFGVFVVCVCYTGAYVIIISSRRNQLFLSASTFFHPFYCITISMEVNETDE